MSKKSSRNVNLQRLLKRGVTVLLMIIFAVAGAYAKKSGASPSRKQIKQGVATEQVQVTQSQESKSAPIVAESAPASAPAKAVSAPPPKEVTGESASQRPEVSPAKPSPAEITNGWTTKPPPSFSPKGKWHRSNLERHWEKHQDEFPEFRNAQEYAIAALYFFEHPPKGTLTKTNADGDKMFYHQESNTFGVVTSDGTPKTMFRPTAGIDYWRRQ